MTSKVPPIGHRESLRLEFKAAAALEKMSNISREAVAMLNAKGGEIWIGLREQDEVATAIDPIARVQARRIDLLNHLVDVIEPGLSSQEVDLRVVGEEAGNGLLLVILTPDPEHQPYALLESGRRSYLKRIDHRVRGMTRDEIHPRIPSSSTRESADDLARSMLTERKQLVSGKRSSLLWLGIQPAPSQALGVHQDQRIRALLLDPTLSGNRRSGYSFHTPFSAPVHGDASIKLGTPDPRLVTIHEDGGVTFEMPLRWLDWDSERPKQIHPYVLLETVISLTRLADKLYALDDARTDVNSVFADIAIVGGKSWTLPAYPPGTHGYLGRHGTPGVIEDDNLDLSKPLSFTALDLHENPDLVGFRIVCALYYFLGLSEDRIPSSFDRAQQRLLLTD